MTSTLYFVRPCPTCGRRTQIALDFLGRQVGCQHCGREFLADGPDSESAAVDDPVNYWINFTDHQLAADHDFYPQELNRIPK